MAKKQNEISLSFNEGQDYDIPFIFDTDTTGETLQIRMREVGSTGTGQAVGSVSGDAASTTITITAQLSLLSEGNYKVEVWQDYGGSNQKMLYPNETEDATFKIVDRFSV